MLNDAISEKILRFHEHYSYFSNTLKGVSTVSGVASLLSFSSQVLISTNQSKHKMETCISK